MSTRALTMPKPKEHGAWGMLYVPLVTAVGISRAWNVRVLLMALAVTLIFLSQRPYAQLITNKRIRQDAWLKRRNLTWLAVYWSTSGTLMCWLYFHYELEALPQFAWIGVSVAAAFTWFLKKNCTRTVAGELSGICGLTLTAPLGHYASVGRVETVGFWLWGLCILYFASSVFYVKAVVANKDKAPQSPVALMSRQLCASYHLVLFALMASLAALGHVPALLLLGFLPVIARGLLGVRRQNAKLNIARIGWTEVVYSFFFAVMTALAVRSAGGTLPL